MGKGYVYILEADEVGRFKIGKAKSIRARMKILDIGSPVDLKLYGYIESEQWDSIERELLKRFKARRKKGEWFNITNDDTERILSDYGGKRYLGSDYATPSKVDKMVFVPISTVSNFMQAFLFIMIGFIALHLNRVGFFEIGKSLAVFQISLSIAASFVLNFVVKSIWNKIYKTKS